MKIFNLSHEYKRWIFSFIELMLKRAKIQWREKKDVSLFFIHKCQRNEFASYSRNAKKKRAFSLQFFFMFDFFNHPWTITIKPNIYWHSSFKRNSLLLLPSYFYDFFFHITRKIRKKKSINFSTDSRIQ